MSDASLPGFLRPLFWDVDFDQLRVPGHEPYIIERMLEYGDAPEVRWLSRRFSREQIAQVLRCTRRFSSKSAHFWSLILDVPREEIRCLSASLSHIESTSNIGGHSDETARKDR